VWALETGMSNYLHLNAFLLDGFRLVVDNQPHRGINQPQQQSLLAYLMLHTHTPQLRRHIAFLFWPDSSEARAFANLRRALHKLRSDCPAIAVYLVTTNTMISWQRSSTFSLDVLAYEALLAQADATTDPTHIRALLTQAADWYRGELLPGCYDDWILPERERLNQRYIHLLHQLTDSLAAEGDYATALHYTTKLRNSDPFREQTYRLLMNLYEGCGDRAAALRVYHDCVAMLHRELGVEPSPETQAIYHRILNRTTPLTPVAPLPAATGDRLIGRQTEWQLLQTTWHKASQGEPRLILIQGEAGIGKTHLAEALLTWGNQHNQLIIHTHAYAAEGQLTYSPVVEWLRSAPYRDLPTRLEDIWLTECSRLLPEFLVARPDLSPPPPLQANWQQQHLFEALARAALVPQKPLLVLLDDLQWADRETLEWLHFLLRFAPTAPLLLVGTVRMSEVAIDHPLMTLLQELHREDRVAEFTLSPLTAAASDELAEQIAGSKLQAETLVDLRRYAEGVPLFLVEAVRAEIDKAVADRWRWSIRTPIAMPNALPLPPRIYAVIQARLNRLSLGARQVANVAAVIGRAFSLELLALASQSDEESLVQNLDELWQRRIVREKGTNYDLSHDRIRDVTYAELPPMQRKLLHRRVAEALTKHHAEKLAAISAELARHYEAAGLLAQAVGYYLQAGTTAQQLYANHRAQELARHGLALVKQLPASALLDQQELDLSLVLVSTVRVLEGWASTALFQLVNQVLVLSHKVEDTAAHFRLRKALFGYLVVSGDLDQAEPMAEQLSAIAHQEQSPLFLVISYNNLAGVKLHRGEFREAQALFAQSLVHYTPTQHKEHVFFDGCDYGILSAIWQSQNLWCLGYPDQALDQCQQGETWSQEFAHPASQTMTLVYLALIYQLRQEPEAVQRFADHSLSLAKEHTIGYYREMAAIFHTWSFAYSNPIPARIGEFQAALNDFRAIGAGLRWSYYLALLAELYGRAREAQRGLDVIDQAFAVVAQTGEHWWDAELYRLRGELLSQQRAEPEQIEAIYQQAIHLAREQGALSLELRATISLVRLWHAKGETAQAYTLLTDVYAQFSEGFETPDLLAAQRLRTNLTA